MRLAQDTRLIMTTGAADNGDNGDDDTSHRRRQNLAGNMRLVFPAERRCLRLLRTQASTLTLVKPVGRTAM